MNYFLLLTIIPLILANPTLPTSYTASGAITMTRNGIPAFAYFDSTLEANLASYMAFSGSSNPAVLPNVKSITNCNDGWWAEVYGSMCFYYCHRSMCNACDNCTVTNEFVEFMNKSQATGITCNVNGRLGERFDYDGNTMCVAGNTILSYTINVAGNQVNLVFNKFSAGSDQSKFVSPGQCKCVNSETQYAPSMFSWL